MLSLCSKTKGQVAEDIVERFLICNDFHVMRSDNSEYDRIINGKKVEIKFSMLWESGVYKFQQIRDQDYDLLICFGISPYSAHCWVIPKCQIMTWWKNNIIISQHGGEKGNDTKWLSVKVDKPQDILHPYGGSLEDAIHCLKDMVK